MKLPTIELWRLFAATAIVATGLATFTEIRHTDSDFWAPFLIFTSFSLFGAGLGILVRRAFLGLLVGCAFPPGLFAAVVVLDLLGIIKIYGS
jgi:uncharacterized membrane protein